MTDTHKPVAELSTEDLVDWLIAANDAYRRGEPIVSDDTYDHVYLAELIKRDPNHPYLEVVQPEPETMGSGKVRHIKPMLSTDKAYTQDEINSFITRVIKHAATVDIAEADLRFRITAKLDGMAANYENNILATRGNGLLGNDISRNLERGLVALGDANSGVGEIVIESNYFNENLNDAFSHPRNFVTGLIGADTLSEQAQEALQDGVIRFVPYSTLPAIECSSEELGSKVEALCAEIEAACEYPVDGSVIDVMNLEVREVLGSTNHHHNWQIAKKLKGETATTIVNAITWQTGRTGRITPVLNVETINLSGADISNVTAHNAGNIVNLNVGIGAEIEIVRSGEVIPKLLAVVKTGADAVVPDTCPTCDAPAQMERDFLVCQGDACAAQVEARLQHFFRTLGNIDLFGPKTIEVLVKHEVTELEAIYALTAEQYEKMGFGPKQSTNLVEQIARSRSEAVEDWRFLASFGIHHLGRGDSRKILQAYPLTGLDTLTSEQLLAITGFGAITAEAIPESLQKQWPTIKALLDLGFNLLTTTIIDSDVEAEVIDSPISGKSLVFTGSMSSSRDAMKETARSLGANVQSSVNKKTDILVIGEKVGAKKIEKAESLGTQVMTEADYLAFIESVTKQ